MKQIQKSLTALIIIQLIIVMLLGATALLNRQNHEEVKRLREALVAEKAASDEEKPLADRVAEVELRLGMRDPNAEKVSSALRDQMAQAAQLDQRFRDLQNGQARARSPIESEETTKSPAPSPLPDTTGMDLSPQEQAIAALPVAGTITEYNEEWEFWIIDRGRFGGMAEGQQYAVRPKDAFNVLASVKVASVRPQDATIELVRGTLQDPNRKPQPGDVLVSTAGLR